LAALSSLGKIVKSTGYVIDPYVEYPNLLVILINFLKTEQQGSIRRETVKVLGILGALDPYKHKVSSLLSPFSFFLFPYKHAVCLIFCFSNKMNQMGLRISDKDSSSNDEEDIDHILIGMPTSSEDYHPTVVIHGYSSISLRNISINNLSINSLNEDSKGLFAKQSSHGRDPGGHVHI